MGIFRPHSSVMLLLKFKIVGMYLVILRPEISNSMAFFPERVDFEAVLILIQNIKNQLSILGYNITCDNIPYTCLLKKCK